MAGTPSTGGPATSNPSPSACKYARQYPGREVDPPRGLPPSEHPEEDVPDEIRPEVDPDGRGEPRSPEGIGRDEGEEAVQEEDLAEEGRWNCLEGVRTGRIMSAGRWLNPKTTAGRTAMIQKSCGCHLPVRSFAETSQVPVEMRKRRKIISSLMDATVEATRDAGKAGWTGCPRPSPHPQ